MGSIMSLGNKFPNFNKPAVVSIEPGKEYTQLNYEDIQKKNKWLLMFWYPNDFSSICPTELIELNKCYYEFEDRDTMVIAASTDTEESHLLWRKEHAGLKDLKYPLLSDSSRSLSGELGIISPDGIATYRVTYIIDPHGMIRWLNGNDMNVGRNIKEIIRVLDALQTDKMCPCNWQKGEATIEMVV